MKTYLINPGGNPTALIKDLKQKISQSKRIKISQELLQKGECEQVAFIEQTSQGIYKCVMMGEELCINALRSVGAWVNLKTGLTNFNLASSGTKQLFSITINKSNIKINLPINYKKKSLTKETQFIELDGIAHFISTKISPTKTELKKLIKQYCNPNKYPAIGLINFTQVSSKTFKIQPLVFVKDTNSYILETACGSASIAILLSQNSRKITVLQPSQEPYKLAINKNKIELSSNVTILNN